MNNDEIYLELKCAGCGQHSYTIKMCNKCKKKYCSSKCAGKIINEQNNVICMTCIVDKNK